jgi:hypothetical protein
VDTFAKRRGNQVATAAGEAAPPAGSEGSGQIQTPYYDHVVLQQREPDLELKENDCSL